MAALKSLLLAIELATTKRDQALAQVQKIMQIQAHATGQMDQLQQYAQETELRWMQGARVSTTPDLLHHHYQFMARLNQAISLQDGVLAGNQQRLDAAKQVLLQAEFRLASFKQVLEGRQADMAKSQQRKEQKQMDEFASMQTQRQIQMRAQAPS